MAGWMDGWTVGRLLPAAVTPVPITPLQDIDDKSPDFSEILNKLGAVTCVVDHFSQISFTSFSNLNLFGNFRKYPKI